MSNAHKRKKQPDLVRHQLLDVAARLCIEQGMHALTLDAVAKSAGVSKGGLLHHFPSKQALLDALAYACVEDFEKRLSKYLASDHASQSTRVARAYLAVIAKNANSSERKHWDNLAALLMTDSGVRTIWNAWFEKYLKENEGDDAPTSCWIVRLAADGLWLSDLTGSPGLSRAKRKKVIAELNKLLDATDV